MEYLTAEEVLIIHSKIIEKTGGLHGVRDVGLLSSAVQRPKTKFSGKELYKDIFKKAAVYLESLATYHTFVDGNKRTSIAVAVRFLFLKPPNTLVFQTKDEGGGGNEPFQIPTLVGI